MKSYLILTTVEFSALTVQNLKKKLHLPSLDLVKISHGFLCVEKEDVAENSNFFKILNRALQNVKSFAV